VSIDAIRAITAQAREQVLAAHHDVGAARDRLEDAVRTLTDLSRNHSESLVLGEHLHAVERLGECLELLAGSLGHIDSFVAGL